MINTNEKVTVGVLACDKCGAPMYPNMEKGGMHCAYCGEFISFALTDADFTPGMTFRHQPLQEINGYLKLGHVAIMDKNALQPPPPVEWPIPLFMSYTYSYSRQINSSIFILLFANSQKNSSFYNKKELPKQPLIFMFSNCQKRLPASG